MTPEEYVEKFDELFKTEKARILKEHSEFRFMGKTPEPYSLEFGIQSGTLNRELRAECKDPEDLKGESLESRANRIRLKWAYAYWWNRAHLLEQMAESNLGNAKTKKNMKKGGDTLKRLIRGEVSIDKIHPEFRRLIETLNRMRVEDAGFTRKSGELLKGE